MGHRGGDRLVVTARADRAALEWALTLADRVVVAHGRPSRVGGRARVGARPGRRPGGEDLGRRARRRSTSGRWRGSSPRPSGGSLRTSSSPASAVSPAPPAPCRRSWPRTSAGRASTAPSGSPARRTSSSSSGAFRAAAARSSPSRARASSPWPRTPSSRATCRSAPGARRRDAATRPGRWRTSVSRRAPCARRCGSAWTAWTGRGRDPAGPPAAAPAGAARSAADRLRQLVGGGRPAAGPGAPAAPPASGLVEGDPRAVADRIMAFLEQHGFV